MTKIGDIVFVQTKGICKIENIAKNAFVGCDKTKEYYILKPVDTTNNMMVYFPTDTKVKMRPLAGKKLAEKLLSGFGDLSSVEISAEEKRFDTYNQIMQEGELEDWCSLLKTLLVRKSKVQKKQFNLQEQKYINLMLGCVVSELAYVLDEAKENIKDKLLENFDNK